ncbi:hypothetical protein J6590_002434 [Homalodisca vitripennis]|nr:hypothetical protein J6590_002434 [Homalodisca vitripennis]
MIDKRCVIDNQVVIGIPVLNDLQRKWPTHQHTIRQIVVSALSKAIGQFRSKYTGTNACVNTDDVYGLPPAARSAISHVPAAAAPPTQLYR